MKKYMAVIKFRRWFLTFHKNCHYYGTDLKSLWKLVYHIARKYDISGYVIHFRTLPEEKLFAVYRSD